MKRQVDWLVNGSLTGPIFSRALNQLTQLEIFPARDKDWPVNECYPDTTLTSCRRVLKQSFRCRLTAFGDWPIAGVWERDDKMD